MKEMTIELRNIEIYARHGCYHEEQLVGGRFIVDADLRVDAEKTASSDDVRNALNYVEACKLMDEVMRTPHHLLESVVAEMASQLRTRFADKGLIGGWVKVRKLAPPIGMQVESVGVRAEI